MMILSRWQTPILAQEFHPVTPTLRSIDDPIFLSS